MMCHPRAKSVGIFGSLFEHVEVPIPNPTQMTPTGIHLTNPKMHSVKVLKLSNHQAVARQQVFPFRGETAEKSTRRSSFAEGGLKGHSLSMCVYVQYT